jgi:hypothetical protein
MKRLFYILPIILLLTSLSANGAEFFSGNFEQALLDAQKQGKNILIDFYSST